MRVVFPAPPGLAPVRIEAPWAMALIPQAAISMLSVPASMRSTMLKVRPPR